MRLFVALDLDERVKGYLYDLQRNVSVEGAKISFSSGFHVTLKFLGEVDTGSLTMIKSELRKVGFESFKAKTSGVGFFKKNNKIRVVWAGIEPKEEIKMLQEKIDDSLYKVGFEKNRKFHSHVTLARVKYLKDKNKFIDNLKSMEKKEINFRVSSFVLFRSRLTRQGPIYEVLEKFKAKQ